MTDPAAVRLRNDVSELPRPARWVHEFCDDHDVPPALAFSFDLALARSSPRSGPMVMDSPEPTVRDFVARIRRRAGPATVVEAFTLTHYNAVRACAAALRKAGEVSRDAVASGLRGLTIDSPTGPLTIGPDHHVTLSVYLARRTAGRLTVVQALGRVAPESGC